MASRQVFILPRIINIHQIAHDFIVNGYLVDDFVSVLNSVVSARNPSSI